MGIFADWQPRYAERGIASFPVVVDEGVKRPAVRGYEKVGPDMSRQLAFRFPDHDALGFMCGRRNGISVLDVDTSDERVLADALARHGATPFVVRSGSGNYQAWYRHGGEQRQIRPWGKELPIDVLGGGYVVAPPSRGARGPNIQGDLDDLTRLPRIGGLARPDTIISYDGAPRRDVGGDCKRNVSLWRACMRRAPKCGTFDDLLDFARSHNQEFRPPLDDAEVVKTANSAWGYTERGENWFGREQEARIDRDTVKKLVGDPDAALLLMTIKLHHEGAEEFVLAKAMAGGLGICVQRFLGARSRIEKMGLIRCIRRGGKGKNTPPIFGWP